MGSNNVTGGNVDAGMEHRFSRVLTMLQARAVCHVVVRCEEHAHARTPDSRTPDARTLDTRAGGEGNTSERPEPLDGADVVAVLLPHCPSGADDWMLVDLAVASGGTVLVDPSTCPPEPGQLKTGKLETGKLEALFRLTSGRVRPGTVGGERMAAATLSVSRPPMSRRGMLARRPPEPVVPHPSGDPRARLVDSLRALGGDQVHGGAPALALDAAACIACGVCVKACAHDALELGTAQGRTTLVQYPDRCQGDQTCVVSCPSQVISVVDHHDWTTVLAGRPLPIARLATTTCDRCRITIPAGRSTCQSCAERAEDPFGVHLPPHLMDRIPAKYHDRLRG